MKLLKLIMLLALGASESAFAQEHAACNSLTYAYEDHAPDELRMIAASCDSKPVANLYYNRAHHSELVSEAAILAGLIAYSDDANRLHLDAYRLYMALIEQMAPVWFSDPVARVNFLNHEYDRRNEIAHLRLRGYDRMADRLEKLTVTR